MVCIHGYVLRSSASALQPLHNGYVQALLYTELLQRRVAASCCRQLLIMGSITQGRVQGGLC
jgi:hypothetical protein